MGDLFGYEPPIAWDEEGRRGAARDGRLISIEQSVLSGRFVARIQLDKRWRECVARRAANSADEARQAAEAVIVACAA